MQTSGPVKTDQELAAAAAGGDRAAFDEIVRRYCRPLTLYAVGRTGSLQDAEDYVQETFMRAYVNIASFDNTYALKNWLFTILYRLIVSGYRKNKPRRLLPNAADDLAASHQAPHENQWLWDIAAKMSTDMFTALWLRYKQQMSTAEIAAVMNRSRISVRVLLYRGRTRLKKSIVSRPELAEKLPRQFNQNAILERIE